MPNKSKYQKEEVINAIVDMRVSKSMSMKSVIHFLMNDLGYGQAMAYNYVKMAQDIIKDSYKNVNDIAIYESTAQVEDMMQYAMTNKNFKLWFELRKELNRMQGNYKDKVDVTTNGENINTTIINIINPNGDKL